MLLLECDMWLSSSLSLIGHCNSDPRWPGSSRLVVDDTVPVQLLVKVSGDVSLVGVVSLEVEVIGLSSASEVFCEGYRQLASGERSIQ